MLHRPLRRAAALSLGALLVFAGTASADTLFADADSVTPVVDGSKHLGDVAPGGTKTADVRFLLVCAGLQHVDAAQSVVVSWSGAGIVPLDGAIVSVSPVMFAPLASPWGADGAGCPDPVPAQEGGALSHVVLRAPTTAGVHTYTIAWDRSVEPAGSNDANAFSRTMTSVNFTLRVVANTAPTINVPAALTQPIEGNTTGGWSADWSGVTATDPEDAPDPTPTCLPAAGTVLLVGPTAVTCTVTDLAGATDTEAFTVTVQDTTAPSLTVPAAISVTTADPSGRAVTFTATATDVVDASPTVTCDHSSGDTFAVGTTTVTCMASDAEWNTSDSASFDVTVQFVAPHTADAIWLSPVAGVSSTFEANRGRTLPIKVRLFVDGDERTDGDAGLTLTPCGGGAAMHLDLAFSGGRWNHSLDTSMLGGSCYDVAATIDGLTAGSFRLTLRGDDTARTATKPATKTVTTARDGGRKAPATTAAEARSKKPAKTSR